MKKILSIITILFLSTSMYAQSNKTLDSKADAKFTKKSQKMVKEITNATADEFTTYVKGHFTTTEMDQKPSGQYAAFLRATLKSDCSMGAKKEALTLLYGDRYNEHASEIKQNSTPQESR